MASKIRVLNEQTINQIAAGEVIENPASVVKELVENSLDAGATDICVEISSGGRQLIRITDNGCGMNSDDALLCLERHATSKIKGFNDLTHVATMGFRGEAVPSIAAISKFTLLTCPAEKDSQATLVIVDGGKIIKCCSAERSPGTTIEVKSLFFNVPVRKKFLRSPTHDETEILKVVTLLALANLSIRFQVISNQQVLLSTNGATLQERIQTLLGAEFNEGLIEVDFQKENFDLKGFIGVPTTSRPNRTGQYLFINGRPIISPLISYAIKEGYGSALAKQRYPIFVLHLNLPGPFFDVNVHPQKKEVRLHQEQELKSLITQAILSSLQFIPQPGFQFAHQKTEETAAVEDPLPFPVFPHAEKPMESFFSASIPLKVRYEEDVKKEKEARPLIAEPPKKMVPKVIASLKNLILAKVQENGQEEIIFIDPHKAHQRMIYEKLLKTQQEQDSAIESQPLLIPETIEFNAIESAILREYQNDFSKLGIQIREFGKNVFIIEAVPAFLKNQDLKDLLSEMLFEFKEYQGTERVEKEKAKKLALIAGRSIIPETATLTLDEAQALVNKLLTCEIPDRCPQGKMVMGKFNSEQLIKKIW